jgi:hypothetical protein
MLGSTLGGVGGWAYSYFVRPRPQTNMFFGSAAIWGALAGTEFGGGASTQSNFKDFNDHMAIGGLVGFNVALAGAAGLSLAWSPSWEQLGFMWGGLAVGTAVSLPVYIFYAGSEKDPRHGLIFQGVAGLLGIGAGALLGRGDGGNRYADNVDHYWENKHHFARLLGGGLSPVPNGMGASIYGQLR